MLNLGLMMASDLAKRTGQSLRSVWLDTRTYTSLKDLAGAIIIVLWSCTSPVAWSSLTERHLEKRFGRVRSHFPNYLMTVSDYWRSSAMVMRKEVRAHLDNLLPHLGPEECITATTFRSIAQRAWQASLKLAAMCSGRSTSDLQSDFHSSNSAATCEAEMDPDDDAEGSASAFLLCSQLSLLMFVATQLESSLTFSHVFTCLQCQDFSPLQENLGKSSQQTWQRFLTVSVIAKPSCVASKRRRRMQMWLWLMSQTTSP